VDGVHVRVRVGREHYAVPVEHVHEVVEVGDLTAVPGSESSMLGLRNLSGEILPVFDLASILQIQGDGRPERLIVVEHGARRLAFAVDGVVDVGELTGKVEEPESPHLQASVVIDGKLVGVLEVGELIEGLTEGGVR
jgi:purine-binding chemotaxis protein CheW